MLWTTEQYKFFAKIILSCKNDDQLDSCVTWFHNIRNYSISRIRENNQIVDYIAEQRKHIKAVKEQQ